MANIEDLESHILDKYSIIQRLGKGAYGVVWRGVNKETKDEVAIKKVNSHEQGVRCISQLHRCPKDFQRGDVPQRTIAPRECCKTTRSDSSTEPERPLPRL
jgi:serine/threonine protein kinase